MNFIISLLVLLLVSFTQVVESNAADTIAHSISATQLKQLLDAEVVELIDVRGTDDFLARHIQGARNIPLGILNTDQMCMTGKKIVLQCESGRRSDKAYELLHEKLPNAQIYSLEGGIKSWEKAGFDVVKPFGKSTFSIMRQVQIIAGCIIILGILLTIYISRYFIIFPLLVGCGLIFAGITGWCGMAIFLGYMPWN